MLIDSSKWERQQKSEFQQVYSPFQQAVESGTEKGYDFNGFSQDLFSSLYQIDPKFPEQASPGTSWAKKALDELKSLPEFNQLRETGTKCDSLQSGLGATILSKRFAETLPKMEEKNPDELQKEIDAAQSFLNEFPENKTVQEALGEAKKKLEASTNAWAEATSQIEPSALRQVFRRAIAQVQEQISEMEETTGSFGFGEGPGQDGYSSPEEKLKVAEQIKNNPKLKEIAELAGRFRREARKVQANKKQPGPDEITDIECGNNIGRLLPSELVKLGNRITKLEFFKKYTENNLLQYKLTERPQEARGPIVVCIDNSGSMRGRKEIFSKAIALALCGIAVDQRRKFVIIHFDTKVKRVDCFDSNKVNPQDLIASCAYFSGGGTDFNVPLDKAFELIEKEKNFKKADIIFITDGDCTLDSKSVIENSTEFQTTIYPISLSGKQPELEKIGKVLYIEDEAELKEKVFSI